MSKINGKERHEELAACRVAIVGLGLMGGSLALALRGKCLEVFAIEPDPLTRQLARDRNIVNRISDTPEKLLPEADLIVLAAPVRTILTQLEDLPSFVPEGAMLIDLGSTKTEIVLKMAELPERFDPLGGHPMCGKERSGLANADPTIYEGAAFTFTPLPRSSLVVRNLAEQLAHSIGAHPLWLDPETHDLWVASTSHLPYLIANTLAAIAPLGARSLVGPGFRSTARLAPSPWSVMRDIMMTNRVNVQAGLRRFSERVQVLEQLLENGDDQALEEFLAQGAWNYERLVQ